MRSRIGLLRLILICLTMGFMFSCELVETDDPCDATLVAPGRSANLYIRLFVADAAGQGLGGEQVSFRISKHPCGAIEKGIVESNGVTSPNGYSFSSYASYDLRNTEDVVVAIVNVDDLNGDGDLVGTTEVLNYNDFFDGTPIEVDMYIERDF